MPRDQDHRRRAALRGGNLQRAGLPTSTGENRGGVGRRLGVARRVGSTHLVPISSPSSGNHQRNCGQSLLCPGFRQHRLTTFARPCCRTRRRRGGRPDSRWRPAASFRGGRQESWFRWAARPRRDLGMGARPHVRVLRRARAAAAMARDAAVRTPRSTDSQRSATAVREQEKVSVKRRPPHTVRVLFTPRDESGSRHRPLPHCRGR